MVETKQAIEKTRWQITTRLPHDEELLFRDHARQMGLDASSLIVLIMLRAGRVGPNDLQIRKVATRAVSGPGKITAHISDPEVYQKVAEVMDNAPSGLSPSRLRRVLIALELEENWLGGEVGVDSR